MFRFDLAGCLVCFRFGLRFFSFLFHFLFRSVSGWFQFTFVFFSLSALFCSLLFRHSYFSDGLFDFDCFDSVSLPLPFVLGFGSLLFGLCSVPVPFLLRSVTTPFRPVSVPLFPVSVPFQTVVVSLPFPYSVRFRPPFRVRWVFGFRFVLRFFFFLYLFRFCSFPVGFSGFIFPFGSVLFFCLNSVTFPF